jgi:hypothetical protein
MKSLFISENPYSNLLQNVLIGIVTGGGGGGRREEGACKHKSFILKKLFWLLLSASQEEKEKGHAGTCLIHSFLMEAISL